MSGETNKIRRLQTRSNTNSNLTITSSKYNILNFMTSTAPSTQPAALPPPLSMTVPYLSSTVHEQQTYTPATTPTPESMLNDELFHGRTGFSEVYSETPESSLFIETITSQSPTFYINTNNNNTDRTNIDSDILGDTTTSTTPTLTLGQLEYQATTLSDVEAQYKLGLCYETGSNNTPRSLEKAFKWYKLAADQGHSLSQCIIGWMYMTGSGADQDYIQAYHWTKLSSIQGNPHAQYQLGNMYMLGLGVSQTDFEKASKWYQLSSNQNHSSALNILGWMYQFGYGVGKDYEKALQHYSNSVKFNNPAALNNIATCYLNGIGTIIKRDPQKAFIYFQAAANHGDITAQNNLAEMYFKGFGGVSLDFNLAFDWFLKSAKTGHPNAQCNLAWMFVNGYGTSEDFEKAMYWYQQSSLRDDSNAQYMLGLIHFNGLLNQCVNYKLGIEYLRRASDQNNWTAINMLGCVYRYGWGSVKIDYEKALELFKKAASEGGNMNAQCNLGEMYMMAHGDSISKGVLKPDLKMAGMWFSLAARQGNEIAMAYLERIVGFEVLSKEIEEMVVEARRGSVGGKQ
ncbi:hypothetical protein HDU76_003548 [Blyttiomyces sp. JEL0837]|nr:hypothetical protein HDU76_003548 [Blyttiomyces sp. JEL0837]